ncbi:uncharacterized protein LOC141902268 [Tubulanus polymorphus]|uniref:uncharacterized protein LOC141902268 n=1 Tax=Tubulanus polymorphus TaxID=672921 RepID=UPI003DA54C9F
MYLMLIFYGLFPWLRATNFNTSAGQEFLVLFLPNKDAIVESSKLTLFVTVHRRCTAPVLVNITTPSYTGFSAITETVSNNEGKCVNLPGNLRINSDEEFVKKVIRVRSNCTIRLWGLNQQIQSTDGFVLLPISEMSIERNEQQIVWYKAVCWHDFKQYCQIAIAVRYNNTKLRIEFPKQITTTNVTNYRNSILSEFEALYIKTVRPFDLTGTVISSDKPISVFSGNDVTRVHDPSTRVRGHDHLCVQLTPVNTWGMSVYSDPTPELNPNYYKLIPARLGTTVLYRAYQTTGSMSNCTIRYLNNSSAKDFSRENLNQLKIIVNSGWILLRVKAGCYLVITAEGPVSLTRFIHSHSRLVPNSDPSMVTLPPVQQFDNSYSFLVPENASRSGEKYTNWVHIAYSQPPDKSDKIQFHVDDILINQDRIVELESMRFIKVKISSGFHSIGNNASHPFSVVVYGSFRYESYLFSLGQKLNIINELKPVWRRENEDGQVTVRELIHGWTNRNPETDRRKSSALARGLFHIGDTNNDGFITAEDIKPLYKQFDMNKDETVSKDEFLQFWINVSNRCRNNRLSEVSS